MSGEVHPLDSGKLDWIWAGELREQGYTDADLLTTSRVLSRSCSMCHAEVGEWCRTAAGHVLGGLDLQHVARRDIS
ncbi:MAG: zinc finger domain-containing protein [Actinopolymorphaceae bacterium]